MMVSHDVLIQVSPQVMAELATLVQTGLFGRDVTEVASQLLRERLRDVIAREAPARHRPPEAPRPAIECERFKSPAAARLHVKLCMASEAAQSSRDKWKPWEAAALSEIDSWEWGL